MVKTALRLLLMWSSRVEYPATFFSHSVILSLLCWSRSSGSLIMGFMSSLVRGSMSPGNLRLLAMYHPKASMDFENWFLSSDLLKHWNTWPFMPSVFPLNFWQQQSTELHRPFHGFHHVLLVLCLGLAHCHFPCLGLFHALGPVG